MKNSTVKRIKLLLCAVMAIALAISSVSLFTASAESDKRESYAFFDISDDENTITSSGKTYTRFDLSSAVKYEPRDSVYSYFRSVNIRREGSVKSHSIESSGDGILVARYGVEVTLYLSDSAKEDISNTINGKASRHRIERGYKTAVISEELFDRISAYAYANKSNAEEIDVSRLKNMDIYTIRAFDASDSICVDTACIYRGSNGELYYLNIADLENNRFDADGNISYRQGTLSLVSIKDRFDDDVSESIDKMRKIEVDETIEYDLIDSFGSEFGGVLASLFWPAYIIVGFLAPAPALVFGIVNPLRKKKGYSKAWYALAVIGALWMITALAILLCFIL